MWKHAFHSAKILNFKFVGIKYAINKVILLIKLMEFILNHWFKMLIIIGDYCIMEFPLDLRLIDSISIIIIIKYILGFILMIE